MHCLRDSALSLCEACLKCSMPRLMKGWVIEREVYPLAPVWALGMPTNEYLFFLSYSSLLLRSGSAGTCAGAYLMMHSCLIRSPLRQARLVTSDSRAAWLSKR
ncbi:hypothetical protein B7L66_21640 [Xanthomonas citri pv. citri]|nr:hypothetical protein B7L66_21640 [Xanthomonas citri pv. citri]ARR19501.1 hypothetical protein B7L65_23350 [Xanthomonas citri pv. citri]ARR22402.1 hypothetical protein B7L67_13235 [Xanthomonas citri pv. citri]